MKIKHNFILLSIKGKYIDKVKSLHIPITWHPEAHHCTFGIAEAVPEKLLYFKKEIDAIKNEFGGTQYAPIDRAEEIRWMTAKSVLYDVPVEVEKDDMVFFHYNVYAQAAQEGRVFRENGVTSILIPYDMCFIAIRNEKIIPLNGLVLLEPVKETRKSEHIIEIEKDSKVMGKIAHLGQKVNGYLQLPTETDDDFYEVGDYVYYRKHSAQPLEYHYHQILQQKYLKLHRCSLLCKVQRALITS